MPDPRPMNPPKPRRRASAKLEPIDWHEFANDAVLNGNMSTLFHRPPSEDPSAYASPEALVEIEKRAQRAVTPASEPQTQAEAAAPTVGTQPAAGAKPALVPVEEAGKNRKVKPIRSVNDALTLAGQVLYQAMYGAEGTEARHCTKGYRQLAAESGLDKDTVRDLIVEFKEKGIVRQIGGYNPDTRSAKTYEVLSSEMLVRGWNEAGYSFVTAGRQRPEFCTAQGQPYRLPKV